MPESVEAAVQVPGVVILLLPDDEPAEVCAPDVLPDPLDPELDVDLVDPETSVEALPSDPSGLSSWLNLLDEVPQA